jgi:DNA-binding response OmpR family regulator
MTCVLVVDDEPIVRDVVVRYLEQAGFDTREAGDGIAAQELIEHTMPNAIVLDVMMPRMDGLELCRWIRARSDVPVIMLTSLGEEADRIVGLELGADDYVTKPFSPRELAVRVKAVLRRTTAGAPKAERIEVGDLAIDAATRDVAKAGRPLRLTATEFDLLWFLVSHPRRVFSRQQLMESVWGYRPSFDTGTVTVHIRRLREKLEDDPSQPRLLETVWGVGYRFTPPSP